MPDLKRDQRAQDIYVVLPDCIMHETNWVDSCDDCKVHRGPHEALVSLLTDVQLAQHSLTELVHLKDGPRNEEYYAAKPHAWRAAREIVYEIESR